MIVSLLVIIALLILRVVQLELHCKDMHEAPYVESEEKE